MYKETSHMTQMIRKQIYIRADQEEVLKRKACELGISEAELVREYIDEGMQRPTAIERKKAWQEELAFIKERAKMRVPQTGRKWTREELYEERFERYSR
jgi:hypothetical protein